MSITLTQVGNDLRNGSANELFRGIVSPNSSNQCGSDLYLMPWGSSCVVKHQTCNDAQQTANVNYLAAPGNNNGNLTKKWAGAAIDGCGVVYGGPHTQPSALTIDTACACAPLACVISTVVRPLPSNPVGDQARGPVADACGANIYTPAYSGNGNTKWYHVDAMTGQEGTPIDYDTPPRTAQIYQARPNWASEQMQWKYTGQNGGVYGKANSDGSSKIFGMPYGSPHISILNTGSGGTATWGTDDLTGNAPLYTGSLITSDTTSFHKYKNGVLASNGHIYAHGEKARSILKINVTTNEATEIPYPTEIINKMVGWSEEVPAMPPNPLVPNGLPAIPAGYHHDTAITPNAASNGSVLGSDGNVYNVPADIPYIIWIDPTDDSIHYENHTFLLNTYNGVDAKGMYGAGVAVGNSIYYAPQRASKVMKMTIS